MPESAVTEMSVHGLAFFGLPKDPKAALWKLPPGRYTLVVVNWKTQVRSNGVGVEIVAPKGRESKAAKVFRSVLQGGARMILEQKEVASVTTSFEELAQTYPDTTYGKYARVALALTRFEKAWVKHRHDGGIAVWGPLLKDLERVETVFTGEHPLREKLLRDLAYARLSCGDYAGARADVAALGTTFPHGLFGRMGAQLERRIARSERQSKVSGDHQ
ncbi:MAG: hypothetical protein GY842_20405 [bacterium]|nr:hypothetical protein [bacterium]